MIMEDGGYIFSKHHSIVTIGEFSLEKFNPLDPEWEPTSDASFENNGYDLFYKNSPTKEIQSFLESKDLYSLCMNIFDDD